LNKSTNFKLPNIKVDEKQFRPSCFVSTDRRTDGRADDGRHKGKRTSPQKSLVCLNSVSSHTNCSDTHVITKEHCIAHVIEFRYRQIDL